MAKEPYQFDDIDGFWAIILSIEWRDPWLIGLIFFHVFITLTALLTRNYSNFQVVLFLVLLLLVYFSESINEIAANNWNVFSNQQYFDSKGMFISLVFAVPILLNCMVMVANWLWQSSQLMTRLRLAQLRQAQSRQQQKQQQQRADTLAARPKLD
ncbi:transmembrane protein 18 [Bacillus rossius redtenbacheri]|uniref:transmembrane protein 18 n=1 Tax=Bacillus rossius redtenbacheri TaxID=93214 RepID=UPI002FDE9ADF